MQELPHVTRTATGNYVQIAGWRPGQRFREGTRIAIHTGDLEPFSTVGDAVADEIGTVVLRLDRPIGYGLDVAGARVSLL